MGTVWLGRDELLRREVALKQIAQTSGLDQGRAEALRTRALHEGRMLSRLTGPHVTSVFDVTLDSGAPWIILEYLPSCSLAQVLHMTGTLPPQQAAQIGAQVADAMIEAHAAGILHRDIKPGNILIADRGTAAGIVKISDFGIARSGPAIAGHAPSVGEQPPAGAGADPSGAGPDVIVGTPAFFAPEIARGYEPTAASDVFSLGAAIYTAVEGVPPFGVDEDHAVVLGRVARAEIAPPHSDHPVMNVVLGMLEPDPARRPSMAGACETLAMAAAGDELDPALVLSSPLLSPDGRIPVWVRKAGGVHRRTAAVPGSTVGGLVAVRHSTPLSQVRTPESRAPRTAPTGSSVAGGPASRAAEHADPERIHADASSRLPRPSPVLRRPHAEWPRRLAIVVAVVVALAVVLTLLVLLAL